MMTEYLYLYIHTLLVLVLVLAVRISTSINNHLNGSSIYTYLLLLLSSLIALVSFYSPLS
jgi:hypothetical protein